MSIGIVACLCAVALSAMATAAMALPAEAQDTSTWRAIDTAVLIDGHVTTAGFASGGAEDATAFELATYAFAPTTGAISYRVNVMHADTAPADALSAVQRAAQSWTDDPDASVAFAYTGPSPGASSSDRANPDGYNDIFWGPTSDTESFLARATIFVDEADVVQEFNIQLNSDFFWTTGSDRGYDIESAVLHELGHGLGFEHVENESVAMRPTLSIGDPFRTLGLGDRSALLKRYGLVCDGRLATHAGTAGDDLLLGSAGPDVVVTGAGNDVIRSFGGGDIICAGTGDDTAYGNGGNDRLFGQSGNDSLWGSVGDDWLVGGGGDDDIHAGSGDDHAFGQAGVDVLDGGDGSDDLRGGPDADVLYGGNGDDALLGSRGDDQLFGERGFDVLDGGPDADVLYGGRAGDMLLGRGGDDQLDGGGGSNDACDSDGDVLPATACELPA